MKTILLAALGAFAFTTGLQANRSSSSYAIVAESIDDGGGASSSAAYSSVSSTGGTAGLATGGAALIARNGFAGQLFDAVGFEIRGPATSVNAGGAVELGVWRLLDDGTLLPIPETLSYQWLRDGAEIPGATSATYTLPSVQSFHTGSYSARVTNGTNTSQVPPASLAVAAPPPNDARLLNLSTRGLAQTGDNVLIPGFVVAGTGTKKLLIRAVGPTLSLDPFNLAGTLPDPRMRLLKRNTSTTLFEEIAANDNWGTNANAAAITQTAADLSAFPFGDDREAALLMDLSPGEYTVIAGGPNNLTGLAIVELYDADSGNPGARLINISNRGFAGVGDQVMIPGFVVSSEGPKTLLVRVVGPRLAADPFNVPGTMADPKLEVFPGGASTPILTNDNWGDNPDAATTASIAEQLFAFPLEAGSKDAAFVVTLPPGSYTVVGSSATAGGTGVVLVEAYVVP